MGVVSACWYVICFELQGAINSGVRTRSDAAAESVAASANCADATADAVARATVFPGALHTAACAGKGCSIVGRVCGGTLVFCDQLCDDGRVSVLRASWRGTVYVVAEKGNSVLFIHVRRETASVDKTVLGQGSRKCDEQGECQEVDSYSPSSYFCRS